MDVSTIKNFALAAQNGSGKTSLAEALLFTAKATSRLGKVDDGTSALDYEPEETKRHLSINSAFYRFSWKKHDLYLADTPGDDNFLAETQMAMSAVDNVILVGDAVTPIKPQTQKIWGMIRATGLPVVIFLNKMDKERADFFGSLEALKEALDVRLVPVALPIGAEASFEGLVDLIHMKAFRFAEDGSGKMEPMEIPADLQQQAGDYRNNLIEYAAESDDDLLEKFLEGGELSPQEIVAGLRAGITQGGFVPVMCGSATKNAGAPLLLDLIVQFLPSPEDRDPIRGLQPVTQEDMERQPSPEAPFSGLVFKTITDPYAGRLSVVRVFSGVLKPDSSAFNPNKESDERIGQIYDIEGKNSKPAEQAPPGAIVAIPKLKEVASGDTLCDKSAPIVFPPVELPTPVLTYALKPHSRSDEEKLTQALSRLQEEDPTLQVSRDAQTNELLLSGCGQVHIDATVEKMARKFGVHVDLSVPQIPYRETIKATKKGEIYRHKKQTGGAGQFAEVHFDISPMERGAGFEFEEALVGMNVPRNFVPAVEKGLHEALQAGPLAGFPVVDVKVRFFDGKSHEVDSSEMAFKIASIQCFKKGMLEAKPVLLEPVVKMTIRVPEDSVGDIIGDLNGRRGKVMGMEPSGREQVITALVPLGEVQRYVLDLNSMTAGQGTFTMEPSHYEEVPPNIADQIIRQAKEAK